MASRTKAAAKSQAPLEPMSAKSLHPLTASRLQDGWQPETALGQRMLKLESLLYVALEERGHKIVRDGATVHGERIDIWLYEPEPVPLSGSERCACETALGGFDQTKEQTMANIGTFTRDGETFSGTISTLAVKAKTTFKPVTKTNDQAPDFRVYASGAEIGAAWSVTSKANKPYLSVKLDDPGFPAAIYCRLVGLSEESQTLIWNR